MITKPKIGDKVYVIWCYSINKLTVGWLGKESFITTDIENHRYIHSKIINYEDYNYVWFKTLKEAKKYLSKRMDDDEKIVSYGKDHWEIVYK